MNKQEAIDSLECFRRNTAHILGDNDEKVKTIETCIMLVEEIEDELPTQANALNALDCISRQAVQDLLDRVSAMHPYKQIGNRESYSTYNEAWTDAINMADAELNSLPSAQPEQLTDKEQRIFLAAMGREEKVCEEADRNYVREPYEDSLVRICHEIIRKVKVALWET